MTRGVVVNVTRITKPISTAQNVSAPTLRRCGWGWKWSGPGVVSGPDRSSGWRDDMDQKKHGSVVGQARRKDIRR
jgi:hypothetical protein